MEHLNNYLKECLRALRGNTSESNSERVAKTLNNLKNITDNVEINLETGQKSNHHSQPSTFADVKKLAEQYHKYNIFHSISGRHHKSFEKFDANLLKGIDYSKLINWLKVKDKYCSKLFVNK